MKTLLTVLAITIPYAAAEQVFQGDGLTGNVDYFLAPANWAAGTVPLETPDDIVVKSTFILDGERISFPAKSLTLDPGQDGFIARGDFIVEGDISVQAGKIEVQRQAMLQWKGEMLVGSLRPSQLSLINGLRDGATSRLDGGSLILGPGSALSFRFIKKVPESLPENTTPLIALSGSLTFQGENRLLFAIEDFETPADLTAGTYLLVRADQITGDLPSLELTGEASSLSARITLEQSVDKRDLVLRVAAP